MPTSTSVRRIVPGKRRNFGRISDEFSVPDLTVHASAQRYTFVRRDGDLSIVRYESASRDFGADLVFDSDGLVISYPGIGQTPPPSG